MSFCSGIRDEAMTLAGESRLGLAALLGITAAFANVIGGSLIVNREWSRG